MNTWEHQKLFDKWRVTRIPYMTDGWVAYRIDSTVGQHVHFDNWREAYTFAYNEVWNQIAF